MGYRSGQQANFPSQYLQPLTMLAQKILVVLEKVFNRNGAQVLLRAAYFRGNDWAKGKDCLDTGWMSSVGGYVDRLKELFTEFIGVRPVVALVNSTAARQLSLKLPRAEPSDEVLAAALTLIATALGNNGRRIQSTISCD